MLLIGMLALLNTYPVVVAENLIVSAKQKDIMSKANLLSSTLSASAGADAVDVSTAADYLGLSSTGHFIVTDSAANIVYDNARVNNQSGRVLMLPEVVSAMKGKDVFSCRYQDGAFETRAAVPIIRDSDVTGVVCFYEYDTEQAQFLIGTQRYIGTMSIAIAAIALIAIMLFTSAFGNRIRSLLDGIHKMREGMYSHRIEMRGNDELSDVASEFNELAGRLQTIEKVRREFVSDASHELKTPLASIKLLSDSIIQADEISQDEVREFLTDINDETDRLTRITEKLLLLTKLDSVSYTESVPVDVREVVLKAASMLRPNAASFGVDLRCELSPNCIISAESDGLYQIVFNLMENAVKYNRPGGSVKVFLFIKEKNVVLMVSDTGIGIPPEDTDRIFDRFYRVDKARSRETGGTGLGLSIVKRRVEAYGGRISVQSRYGESTTFTVSFPLFKEAQQ